jgi:hypothetical protein
MMGINESKINIHDILKKYYYVEFDVIKNVLFRGVYTVRVVLTPKENNTFEKGQFLLYWTEWIDQNGSLRIRETNDALLKTTLFKDLNIYDDLLAYLYEKSKELVLQRLKDSQ